MTIAAAYLTSEGVVLGTDSTTTVNMSGGVGQLLNYAQKLFKVGINSRFAVCTWGAAQIGNVSHRTLLARLGSKIDPSTITVAQTAQMFKDIVLEEYKDGGSTGEVGYCIGGCNVGNHLPECHTIFLKPKEAPVLATLTIGQAQFFGCPEFFTRVFYGFDPKLGELLIKQFKSVLPTQKSKDEVESVFAKAFQEATLPLAAWGYRDLPVREAIDFVHTYLHITIKAYKFKIGAPVCGGPIEIGFISTDRPFRWVCHKRFERAIYDQDF